MSKKTSEPKSYPVWVGSLDQSVDEKTLRQSFKKFGPIRNVQVIKESGKQKSGIK